MTGAAGDGRRCRRAGLVTAVTVRGAAVGVGVVGQDVDDVGGGSSSMVAVSSTATGGSLTLVTLM